jgi:hypothetical protein
MSARRLIYAVLHGDHWSRDQAAIVEEDDSFDKGPDNDIYSRQSFDLIRVITNISVSPSRLCM